MHLVRLTKIFFEQTLHQVYTNDKIKQKDGLRIFLLFTVLFNFLIFVDAVTLKQDYHSVT